MRTVTTRVLSLLLFIFLVQSCTRSNIAKISGESFPKQIITIYLFGEDSFVFVDSLQTLADGKFTFSFPLESSQLSVIEFKESYGATPTRKYLYLSPNKEILVNGTDLKNSNISVNGSYETTVLNNFIDKIQESIKDTSQTISKIESKIESFVTNNITSPIAVIPFYLDINSMFIKEDSSLYLSSLKMFYLAKKTDSILSIRKKSDPLVKRFHKDFTEVNNKRQALSLAKNVINKQSTIQSPMILEGTLFSSNKAISLQNLYSKHKLISFVVSDNLCKSYIDSLWIVTSKYKWQRLDHISLFLPFFDKTYHSSKNTPEAGDMELNNFGRTNYYNAYINSISNSKTILDSLSRLYALTVIPTTFVLNRDNKLVGIVNSPSDLITILDSIEVDRVNNLSARNIGE